MSKSLKSLIIAAVMAVGLSFGASDSFAKTVTIKSGDTLGMHFPTNWQQVGEKYGINPHLIFPNQVFSDDGLGQAVVASNAAPVTNVAPSPTTTPQTTYRASGGPNGYGWGWCTWYVKERRPDIGGYWGNAGYNWLTAARNAGFQTGSAPRAGAIGVTAGHVVYVEYVTGNMVNISEMGWNYTQGAYNNRTVPASSFTYIY